MRICSIEGCEKKVYAKDLCQMHYMRFLRHGDPNFVMSEQHGMSSLPEYSIWVHMKGRCGNEGNPRFYAYGGRGIFVCERWKKSFKDFYSDMGPRPSKTHQLDRIDNDKGYSPDNCRWTTPIENIRNGRTAKLNKIQVLEIKQALKDGITCAELSKKYRVSYSAIHGIKAKRYWVDV